MLRNRVLLMTCLLFVGHALIAQADLNQGWNWSITEGGRIGIHHTEKPDNYTAHITVYYDNQHFYTMKDIEAGEWGFVNFPEDFGFTVENMPDQSGVIKAKLIIEVEADLVCQSNYYFTATNANQPYGISIEEIQDRINLYGTEIDDCIFWHDYKGFNYVIRSHNEGNGIYLAHWVMDVSGETEQLDYYISKDQCDKELIQYHSIGWKLEDANNDGYMEFYTMIVDGCEVDANHPVDAQLLVFTSNLRGLYLKGETYNLLDEGDVGGRYVVSENLEGQSEIQKEAEDAWEVYIMD